MTTITKPCHDCERPVKVDIPDDLTGIYRRILEETPQRCAPHQAEAEKRWEREDHEREEAEIAATVQQRERACGLPPELRRLSWDDIDTVGTRARAVAAARRWADGDLRGLLLLGAVGRGKTFIAAAAAWHRLRHESLRWTSASALVAALDGGFGSEGRSTALGIINGRGGLVLDDLDKVRPTTYVAEMLLLAIDNRITAGRPLIVTMNTEPSELAKHLPEPFGDAIVSRLRGYCKGYRLAGADRRVSS